MLNSEEEDARIISVLEKAYHEFPDEIVAYDALRDNTISLADVYNIIYRVQLDYKQAIEKPADEDPVRQAVLQELFLGNDTLAMLKERRDKMANRILKNELEHIVWYNTLKPYEINDVMLYHRVSLVDHAWELLDKGESSDIARDAVIKELCDCFNKQVAMLDRIRNKQDAELKRMVIGSIYQTLGNMDLSDNEMQHIEQSLRRLLKQSK
jgi:hypothetical protein